MSAAHALATALRDLTADAVPGCTLETAVLHGTYTDGRGGYAGNLRRSLDPRELQALLDEHTAQADALRAVYRERAHLIALLAALYPSHIGYTDPAEPDWALVVIESPAGQLSWHIAPGDMDLFAHVQATSRICRGWDGHSTDEKYRRMRGLTATTEPFPLPPLAPPVRPAYPGDGGAR